MARDLVAAARRVTATWGILLWYKDLSEHGHIPQCAKHESRLQHVRAGSVQALADLEVAIHGDALWIAVQSYPQTA